MTRLILFSIVFLVIQLLSAQNGTIRGKVIDDETGETVIGASVIIAGTTNGTSTDLDGEFSLSTAPGNYTLEISFISYQKTTISEVKVEKGNVAVIGTVRLKSAAQELGIVEITATATRKSEAAINTMKKKSATMMDGISAEKMALTGDGSAVDAAKRVTGVSIEGGKYVYVRGLGDRYSKVTLNSVEIPGLDPDKNSLQMDIFPTNIIDNIIVSKNFTADLPADFAGGVLNIETKAFPEEETFSISASLGFNPEMNLNSEFVTYEGGETDWLGYDDGTRSLPENSRGRDIPNPLDSRYSDEQINQFINSFNPNLATQQQTSFLDYSLGVNYGNQIQLNTDNPKNPRLGYTFSLSYKTDYHFYDDIIFGEYNIQGDPDEYELLLATEQTGELGEQSVLIGAMAGIAYKNNKNKYRLNLMHLQNGTNRAAKLDVFVNEDNPAVSPFDGAISDNLEYQQRSLTNLLLHGKHSLSDKWEVDWRVSPTYSISNDPDVRRTAFTLREDDITFNGGAGGFPLRLWRNLNEINAHAKGDVTYSYKLIGEDAKFKFGFSQLYKYRDYEILTYNARFFDATQNWDSADPNLVLNDDFIYPNRPYSTYYLSGNGEPNPNEYQSQVYNTAAYISNEFNINSALKSIVGVRVENFVQTHTGRDINFASGNIEQGNNLDNEEVLNSLKLFPSINFIYSLAEETNLRLAYARTVARPSFKELSFAQIVDPFTNRTFNGGLFSYSFQDANGNIVTDWDGNLQSTDIDNFDLRIEKFLERGQIYSATVFYKRFENPIELIRIPQAPQPDFQPRNVGDGQVYGVELEAVRSLDFISEKVSKFSVSGNITLVYSEIEMTEREINARTTFDKTEIANEEDGALRSLLYVTDEDLDFDESRTTRDMAGQSPYVVNFGLTYQDYEKGMNIGLFYNVKGPTLQIISSGFVPDVYQNPFNQLNFGFNKKLGKDMNTTIDFNVSNLLDDDIESVYKAYGAEDQFFSRFSPGRTFSIGVNHKF